MYDIEKIRGCFPILGEKIYNKPLVYLDNGATTQKPQCVIDSITDIYTHYNSNVHRGVHHLSNICTDKAEEARRKVAQYINAQSDTEIIFTRGTTESINLLAFSFGESFCCQGDEIIISEMEHHANIVPWQMLCERKGMRLRVAPINDKGELIVDEMFNLINHRTKLIALTHISNVMGSVNPIEQVIRKAHSEAIPVMIDAAQSIPHQKIDVQALDCDFLVFSGHKMYAPNGVGALYGKGDWLNRMIPYHGGGEMIDKVTFERTTYNVLPFKFEAGTPDYVAVIGLGTAIDFINSIGIENIENHEHTLVDYCIEQLSKIDGIRFIGEADKHAGAVSFLVGNVHPYDTGMILDKMGIAVRTGHHCAQPLMDRFGISGTVRASFGMYNTKSEIDKLAEGVERVKMMFG
ncbi:MAG: cysteine desulfurase [Bacteroidales bacterium]|nr:cysteine desulfurase [Bacteroidales bacterium]